MKIGNTNYTHGLFLAPMAGVADRAFRLMCKKYGAEGVTTEMISAKAVCYGDKKTEKLAYIGDDEKPCALQLFGSDPETMRRASRICKKFSPVAIDINMGCPVHKVVSSGDGSALMKNPYLTYTILKEIVDEVAGELPVTVKIRAGFDESSKNAVEIATLAERAGVSAICVHGRTRAQMYSPPADLDIIKAVKCAVSVPVIGNGDIFSADDALRMYEYTGCDGIMVGRGALGNPYIFKEIKDALDGKPHIKQNPREKYADICEHLKLISEDKGEYTAATESRKHISWYLKGVRGGAALRDRVNRTESVEEILSLIKDAFV